MANVKLVLRRHKKTATGEVPVYIRITGFDYVIGFKPKKILSTTLYLGGGALLGIEKSDAAELYPPKNLYGLNLLAELEIAPFPLFSFGLQYLSLIHI